MKYKKRISTAAVSIVLILFLVAATKKPSEPELVVSEVVESLPDGPGEIVEEDIHYLAMDLGRGVYAPSGEQYKDELELLFDKFEFRYEYRDYFRQICVAQNVDPVLAISLCRIESWAGNHPGYNERSVERMYYTKGIATWDMGLFQMSDFYSEYWEAEFYNPELIFSLGYVRNNFDLADDYISMQVGISYIDFLLKYYHGDREKAISAYNTGFVRVNNNTVLEVTKQYTKAILNSWKFREGDI